MSVGEEDAADGWVIAVGISADTAEEGTSELRFPGWGLRRTFTANLRDLGAYHGRCGLTEGNKEHVGVSAVSWAIASVGTSCQRK